MSREGIFNRCQREPKERQETRTKRIREFDVRRTKNLLLYTSENRVPTVVSLGPVVAPVSVRACQILAQSFQAFRDVFPRERFPRFRVARIRSDFVPGARVRIVHSRENSRRLISRAREKNVGENSPAALLLSSLARETRVYGPFVCATC